MTRRFEGDTLLVATHNKGKLEEMAHLLAPFGVKVVGAGEMNLPEPEETEETFVGNARIKAHSAARATGLPALSDDSGITISMPKALFCCNTFQKGSPFFCSPH